MCTAAPRSRGNTQACSAQPLGVSAPTTISLAGNLALGSHGGALVITAIATMARPLANSARPPPCLADQALELIGGKWKPMLL